MFHKTFVRFVLPLLLCFTAGALLEWHGNEPPRIEIDLLGCNQSFYFEGVPIEYTVRVSDVEDGSLLDGGIEADQVVFSAEYRPEGIDLTSKTEGKPVEHSVDNHETGKNLVESGTCLSCHELDYGSIGPSFVEIAEKYQNQSEARAHLVTTIVEGSVGVWGDIAMPSHPQLAQGEVKQMVDYILSVIQEEATASSLPLEGIYTVPEITPEGLVVLRASYTDREANGISGTFTEEFLVLRNSTVEITNGAFSEGVVSSDSSVEPNKERVQVSESGSYVKFADLDLTGLARVQLMAMMPSHLNGQGGIIEVRLDSPEGPLIGQTDSITAPSLAPYDVVLEAVTGIYDLYFVFVHEEASENTLFVVTTAEFISSQQEGEVDHSTHSH